jgi:hypothetical protein
MFTVPIMLLLSVCSAIGIAVPNFYGREAPEWAAQTIGQDLANLIVFVPGLLLSALFAAKGYRSASIIWAGLMLTNVYDYAIYCFAVPFNFLFHVYCAIFGLSLYAALHFFIGQRHLDIGSWFDRRVPVRAVAFFLIGVAALFMLLWLSASLPPALLNQVPESVTRAGLLTNPVHVLDFSFYLPLMCLAAVKLMKKQPAGYLLAPVMIVFVLLTNLNIVALSIVEMKLLGFNTWPMIAGFTVFTLICLGFLWLMLSRLSPQAHRRVE